MTSGELEPQARTGLRYAILCIVSGLLTALAFSTHSTGWVVWVSFVPWLYVLFRQQAKASTYAWYSWIFGMSFYIGVIHWLKELHPLTWLPGVTIPTSLAIVYGGIFGISLVVSLWTALMGGILGALKPSGWRLVVYPALLWILMEYAQELGELSLPWARLAISQYQNLWLLQIVPHTGQLLISGLIIAFNAALAKFLLEFVPEAKPKAYWHYPGFRALLVVAGLVSANLIYGAQRLSQAPDPEQQDAKGIYVSLAQGNIPQGQKWDQVDPFKHLLEIEKIYLDLSYEAIKNGPDLQTEKQPGLIVWPESAVPLMLRDRDDVNPQYSQVLLSTRQHYQQLAHDGQRYFISGAFDQPDAKSSYFNAALLTEPGGKMEQWYYKRQLVPFGEYFPYRAQLESIPVLGGLVAKLNPMESDTGRGKDAALFQTDFGKLGTLICFESVYPHVARDSVKAGANLLVIITNDGWYRDAIALYQHLGHGVLRALENQRYVVRAGNTGITAFIDEYGRVLAQTKPLERTQLSRMVSKQSLHSNLTLATQWGDWMIWVALLALIGCEILGLTMKPINDM